jgi:hypothetical protein
MELIRGCATGANMVRWGVGSCAFSLLGTILIVRIAHGMNMECRKAGVLTRKGEWVHSGSLLFLCNGSALLAYGLSKTLHFEPHVLPAPLTAFARQGLKVWTGYSLMSALAYTANLMPDPARTENWQLASTASAALCAILGGVLLPGAVTASWLLGATAGFLGRNGQLLVAFGGLGTWLAMAYFYSEYGLGATCPSQGGQP